MMQRRVMTMKLVCGVACGVAGVLFVGACGGPARQESTALRDFNQERAASLDRAMALADQAQSAQREGKNAEAIVLYEQSIAARADIASVWHNYGVVLMLENDYVRAADAFRTAADLAPTDPRAYENLGLIYLERGFHEDALRYYGMALARDGNYLPALRGAVASAKALLRSDEQIAEWIRRGLLQESDPRWLEIFQSQRIRVEGELRDRERDRDRRG